MRDDPRRNVKWMQQQLMEAEAPKPFASEDDDLMERIDALLDDFAQEETPVGNFGPRSRGARVEQAHVYQQFDPSAAVLTKSKKQLRKEKLAEKKANVNTKIAGLMFLAILECIGILAILGWWLQ